VIKTDGRNAKESPPISFDNHYGTSSVIKTDGHDAKQSTTISFDDNKVPY